MAICLALGNGTNSYDHAGAESAEAVYRRAGCEVICGPLSEFGDGPWQYDLDHCPYDHSPRP